MPEVFVCEEISNELHTRVVRVFDEDKKRVIGIFSFEDDLSPILDLQAYSLEQTAALRAAKTFLEVGE